jgi:cytochrome c553
MRKRHFARLWVILAALLVWSVNAPAQQPAPQQPEQRIIAEGAGARVFGTCGSCHGKIDEAPSLASLKKMTPEKVYEAITTGIMKAQAAQLSEQQRIDLAEWIGGRKLGSTGNGERLHRSLLGEKS